jgi:hypothetical protein
VPEVQGETVPASTNETETPRRCFVLGPTGEAGSEIREHSDRLLKYVITPICQQHNYNILRSDFTEDMGVLTTQLIEQLIISDLVIADLSFRHPNVMYGLGIVHAVMKPSIMLISKGERIPFDMAGARMIIFDIRDIASINAVQEQLSKAIGLILTPGYRMDEAYKAKHARLISISKEEDKYKTKEPEGKTEQLEEIANAILALGRRLGHIEERLFNIRREEESEKEYSRRVFIVHGRDSGIKQELARILEKLDFEPVILHEQADRGQSIFTKLSKSNCSSPG